MLGKIQMLESKRSIYIKNKVSYKGRFNKTAIFEMRANFAVMMSHDYDRSIGALHNRITRPDC